MDLDLPMKHLPIILAALLLCSCSAEKRLQRLVAKHPELTRSDTITVRDTVILPADTVIMSRFLNTVDTVRVEGPRQVITLYRQATGHPCDTVEVFIHAEGIVKTDTVTTEVEVVVEKLVPCPPGKRVASWWRIVALVLALVLAFVLYVRKS